MSATLPNPLAGIARRVHALMSAHRADLRTRVYATPALNPPTAPHEVVPVTTADGVRLRVHAYGPADGEVLVLVHGWSCCLEYWNPQINEFADRYRVIAYDQRGHGETELGDARVNTDLLAEDLSTVLAAVLRPGQRAVLVGHSLGGMTIQAWASRYSEQVAQRAAAVLLTNSAPYGLIAATTVVPLFNRGLIVLPDLLGRLGLGAPIVFPPIRPVRWVFRRQVMSLAATGDIADFSLAIVRSCPARVRAKFGILLAEMNVGRGAANLTVPTTVIAGSRDDLTPVVHSERIVEMLREAGSFVKMVVLRTGHLGNVEDYERFNDELALVLGAAFHRVREVSA
ncbi:alpha/beta fold hydrolase [Nocardia pseudobrasiliensis]|uniref:Pimeloyl-ACP methyl ester carboxylesterase n=1 Tax=Nocardia pseudobrasiliensis TaxID=45979 RepID=A0A370I6V0_9NOCA|nr:alpha/beta hydrolase [Nocardia pseudobrasiliensis]RDI66360.1 pimeloyl-ACP methyl ester carboxylesterase [Nocardia pseudobrasiliensis]